MWICSKLGFFSIVTKERGAFQVRARVRGDLEQLLDQANLHRVPIETWNQADYRYRIRVSKSELTLLVQVLALTIDYPNFKAEIGGQPSQLVKLQAYSSFWANMIAVQDRVETRASII